MTSSKLHDYLLMGPPLNTIILGVRASTHGFGVGGGNTNVQSITNGHKSFPSPNPSLRSNKSHLLLRRDKS